MTDSSVVVRITDVSKRFVLRKDKSLKERLVNFGRGRRHREDFSALKDVTFDIERGTTVGLIGPNGSGKSTLLKVIGGIIQPTTGKVLRRGRLAALLELGAGFHPDLTGRENVYLNAAILGLTQAETEERFDDIVDFSGIAPFIDTQVKFYSSGMYVRLAFAVAVHVDPDILIIDEVLAVGDEPFQRKCLDRVRSFQLEGKTIILVTHSLDTVATMCDRAIVLKNGVVVHDGDPVVATHVLRNEFAEVSRADGGFVETAEAGGFRLTDARIVSTSDERANGVIEPGDDLELSVEVTSEVDPAEWVIGMGIEATSGALVYGTNNEILDQVLSSDGGTARVRFRLPGMSLGAGQYFFHVSAGTRSGGETVRIPRAGEFQVDSVDRSEGVLRVGASVDTTP
jgi:ABC-2 type transport system ATP-binding protein